MQLQARARDGRLVIFELNIPTALDRMVAAYSEITVLRLAMEKLKTKAMNSARHQLNLGHTPEQVKLKMEKDWHPFFRMENKTMSVLNMTDEEIKAAIKGLEERKDDIA